MKRFVEGECRDQSILFPETLDEYIGEDNPVRVIDVFVDQLNLGELGFDGVLPAHTGRPAYHPASLLKIYIYGYLNRIQSSRRLEREARRNLELMWLTGRLAPDFKTIADFRRDNGSAICRVCREFVVLCRNLKLFSDAVVAIDGSQAKAIMEVLQITAIADRGYFRGEEIVACDEAGITAFVPKPQTSSAKAEGRFNNDEFIYYAAKDEYQCPAGSRLIWRYTSIEDELRIHRYWSSDCKRCPIKEKCTPGDYRRIRRWENAM